MQPSVFSLTQGTIPIVVSMPHNGSEFPDEVKSQFVDGALVSRDTDWFLDRLYQFSQNMGCSILSPKYSRYVIDINRAADGSELYPGADNTELCPTTAFNWTKLYPAGKKPQATEISNRVEKYWQPYHQALNDEITRLRVSHPKIILFEAHSIASHVERFFEGQLSDFNFGNNDGKSCSPELIAALQQNLQLNPYSSVFNGRFKGGYITRQYGNPNKGIHAIQLELSQATYMDEDSLGWNDVKAEKVMPKLKQIFEILINTL